MTPSPFMIHVVEIPIVMVEAPEKLEDLLDQAGPIAVANGWITSEKWVEADLHIRMGNRPAPMAGRSVLSAALLERKILTRDQILDLEAIILSQRLFTDFRLERKLGSGGMGTVFLAMHLPTKRQVALKTINARLAEDRDFVERFHREARALERLDHPNVAQIIASGEEEGHCWLAMEYIQGPSLMSMLKKHKVLPEAWCIQVARQIADGLGYVWSTAALVHRDLKPENILVMSEDLSAVPVAKLIDFGLVKNNQEDDRLTQTGMTIGTPLYMSPEQVRGEKLDVRSDIYGLGATIFHLLTGGTPFNGSSPGTIMSAHLTEAVPDPATRVPSLSMATRSLVMTAMTKAVDQRFLTCEAFIQACDQALEATDPARGEAMPKLLRKPLVLKKPVRRSDVVERTPIGNQALPPLAMPEPVAKTSERVSRTRESNRQPKLAERPAPETEEQRRDAQLAPTELLPDPVSGPLTPNVPGAGRPPAQRKLRTPLPMASARISVTPPPIERARTQSAAFTEPAHAGGVGLMPWVVLGVAVLALVAYLVMA